MRLDKALIYNKGRAGVVRGGGKRIMLESCWMQLSPNHAKPFHWGAASGDHRQVMPSDAKSPGRANLGRVCTLNLANEITARAHVSPSVSLIERKSRQQSSGLGPLLIIPHGLLGFCGALLNEEIRWDYTVRSST